MTYVASTFPKFNSSLSLFDPFLSTSLCGKARVQTVMYLFSIPQTHGLYHIWGAAVIFWHSSMSFLHVNISVSAICHRSEVLHQAGRGFALHNTAAEGHQGDCNIPCAEQCQPGCAAAHLHHQEGVHPLPILPGETELLPNHHT